ncbi:MAG: hypothetical protein ACYTF8_02560 [Planctomycetota bacterium]|jgi:hypothetical protein
MKHAVILLLAALAAAQPLSDKDKRRPRKWLAVDLPWRNLVLAKGVEVAESSRSLREAFPYLLASREPEPKDGYHLTAGNLHHFLKGPISSGEQAFEAARTFIAGPLVTSAEAAERVVARAKEQPRSLGIEIHDYRPKAYAPVMAQARACRRKVRSPTRSSRSWMGRCFRGRPPATSTWKRKSGSAPRPAPR